MHPLIEASHLFVAPSPSPKVVQTPTAIRFPNAFSLLSSLSHFNPSYQIHLPLLIKRPLILQPRPILTQAPNLLTIPIGKRIGGARVPRIGPVFLDVLKEFPLLLQYYRKIISKSVFPTKQQQTKMPTPPPQRNEERGSTKTFSLTALNSPLHPPPRIRPNTHPPTLGPANHPTAPTASVTPPATKIGSTPPTKLKMSRFGCEAMYWLPAKNVELERASEKARL